MNHGVIINYNGYFGDVRECTITKTKENHPFKQQSTRALKLQLFSLDLDQRHREQPNVGNPFSPLFSLYLLV